MYKIKLPDENFDVPERSNFIYFPIFGIMQCPLIRLFCAFADSTWMNLLTAQNGLV